tara:strand:+ start:687 stop:917 length:231 start_codon:yes stop_codon:yes gene_type:complete
MTTQLEVKTFKGTDNNTSPWGWQIVKVWADGHEAVLNLGSGFKTKASAKSAAFGFLGLAKSIEKSQPTNRDGSKQR